MNKEKYLPLSIFAGIFAIEFAVGFYISYIIGYMHSDSLSRVANAFYVLYSRDPHLAAIGFVWNPLPSFLELILLLFYPLFPELASHGIAAIIVSSIFAGLISMLIYNTCRKFGLPKWLGLSISLLYSLNPFIFLFGANGLSDAPYVFFLMYCVINFTNWMTNKHTAHLLKSGVGIALAFWTRYEAVPVGVALAFAVVIVIISIFDKQTDAGNNSIRKKFHHIEAAWIVLLAPAVFSGLLWVFFNYTIMHDPFYFLSSEYSNSAQSEELKRDTDFQAIFNSPLQALWLCVKKTIWFSGPLVGILLIRLFNRRLFKWDLLVLLLIIASVPGLQFLLLMKSSTFAWFRYFMYVLPITIAWIPYELSKVKKGFINYSLILLSLLVTIGVLTYALTNPKIAPDENSFLSIEKGIYYQRTKLDRSIAVWLDENLPDATILTDSAAAYMILVNSKQPKKFIITSDEQFRSSVKDPIGTGVDYILIPRLPVYSTINSEYPKLFDSGSSWTTLYKSFQDKGQNYEWRLYKVNK
ncbi:ArnT family glycosyltransferase [Paenibacillus radicis (ex Xue et al. 2023)]|uniref:Glycosyltransferase family 39 protein n=1 Tax=Paenibacillus radicis (ex Xue et al. 2023) TaxID=2972489 RepID=A0ABT1YJJ0_9BACL|nr:glycosyltransferase family 39 protein [Paenibacillus radicis (ex Xue et al. 2023)]MCR8632579.1 glycosyltransferase family 39 protein [Paenibacillus radicis (ex Xue et al. 2023)]